ncbi:MAG TPA: hypothetical protein VGU71_11490 [Candidatus Dormibacteraeota bacterium]|nr:hypothetical protein [Candidatus Dormibacteraeota bacterium]
MHNLLRKPLTWMILAEFAVVAALTLMAWHVLAAPSHQQTAAPPGASASVGSPDAAAQASPAVPTSDKSVARQLPGLNVDAAFWRLRLVELNRDEAVFEQLEWRIVHSAMDTTQRYLESVVLPSVLRAERGGS